MLNTNHGITFLSIMVFYFSKIVEIVRNQICLDTNPNMYLVANTSVVFLLYTVGSVKSKYGKSENTCLGKGKSQYVDLLPKNPNMFFFISKYDVLPQILETQVWYLKNPNWCKDKIHVGKTCTISMFGK